MHIKKFRARSSHEALTKVKKEFGADALIVETRRLDDGLCEVTAALDRDDTAAPPLTTVSEATGIMEEMREIKELLFSITGKRGDEGEAFRTLKRQMMANGLDAGLTLNILAKACAKARGKCGEGEIDIIPLRNMVRTELRESIKVRDPMRDARLISFIGPTGAGKTTTIAKLAAITVLKKTKNVALLTMDTGRVGAAEQLIKYGRIIGVPVGSASTKEEISAFVEKYNRCRFIFIDTPGSDMKNREYMRRLRGLRSVSPELKFNLVLSVRERDESLFECLRGFSTLAIDAITFTKLDESSSFGQMLVLSKRAGRPISYLGTGQRVPRDLMPATVKRVLNYLMPSQG